MAALEQAYTSGGMKGYWRTYLDLATRPSSDLHRSAYVMARIHAEPGERDAAFRWLGTACDERDGGLSLLALDPGLDSLRGDARFTAVLERVGLARTQTRHRRAA